LGETMRKFLLVVAVLGSVCLTPVRALASASGSLYLPNLGANVTGTNLGGGKFGLDVAATFSEQALGIDGAAQPAQSKVVAGSDGVNSYTLLTDSLGQLQVGVTASVLPTGAATAAKQDTGNTSLGSIDTKITTTANGIKVDGSAVTQPISAASLPLPTGAATSANQTTANTSLASIDGKIPSQGQAVMAASVPVVISSNQSAVPASQSGTWNINNVSGTISLPTGAATSANQTTANTSLSSIDTKLSSQATAANQSTANTSLSSIDTKVGQTPINTSGSQATASISAVTTLTAPANTVGFILQSSLSNTDNLRWRVGGAATTTTGMLLAPGQDSGYVPAGANVSVIPVSGTQEYEIQWVVR
jgi:hypothetical protein